MSEQKQMDMGIEEGAEELPPDGLLSNAVYGPTKAAEAAKQGHGRLALEWAVQSMGLVALAMVRMREGGDDE